MLFYKNYKITFIYLFKIYNFLYFYPRILQINKQKLKQIFIYEMISGNIDMNLT